MFSSTGKEGVHSDIMSQSDSTIFFSLAKAAFASCLKKEVVSNKGDALADALFCRLVRCYINLD